MLGLPSICFQVISLVVKACLICVAQASALTEAASCWRRRAVGCAAVCDLKSLVQALCACLACNSQECSCTFCRQLVGAAWWWSGMVGSQCTCRRAKAQVIPISANGTAIHSDMWSHLCLVPCVLLQLLHQNISMSACADHPSR